MHESPWRNGLARWTSNSKVPGSNPGGGRIFFKLTIFNVPFYDTFGIVFDASFYYTSPRGATD